MSTCTQCNGDGTIDCPRCKANEDSIISQLLAHLSLLCPECKGIGKIFCGTCDGSGDIEN